MIVRNIFCFQDNNKTGYLAILNVKGDNGKYNAIKYYGNKFGDQYEFANPELFNTKTVRSSADFAKYIKLYNPGLFVNPIFVNGVAFDIPFIHLNTGDAVKWEPLFEKHVTYDSFNIISEDSIIEYFWYKNIFLSLLDQKRHQQASNSERLLVNCKTGLVTRKITKASKEKYFEGTWSCIGGKWIRENYYEIPIAGYKSR